MLDAFLTAYGISDGFSDLLIASARTIADNHSL